nr:TonB-dependent receptor [uncultured Porphyromonas sp.]
MKHAHMLCVVLALSSGSLLAQTTFPLQGTLKKTADRTPVDFANVLLRKPADSTLVVGTTSNELGAFRLEAPQGTFLLEIHALGYKPFHKTLTLTGALDLGELLLTEETKELSAVQVTGRRPIMLRKADRMVFDATQIAPAASSALDVLRQTPGVNVSDGGISLIGKGGVIVLINDKRVRLSGAALIGLLRSYPQSDLQEIQILTTPPAKYEAEGNAGVLNIILKKAKNDFFGGSIAPRFGFRRERAMYSLNTNLNYKKDKVTASLQLGGGWASYDGFLGTYRTYPKQGTFHSSETAFSGKGPHFNVRAGLDYAFTPELSMGVNVSYSPQKDDTRRENDSRDYRILSSKAYELLRLLPGVADETDKSQYTTANVHLEKTFKSAPQRRLSWDADYVGYRSLEGRNFTSRGLMPNGTPIPGSDFHFDALTDQHTDSYITSLDYTEPLGKGKLGFGAKGTWTRTTNRSDYDAKSSMGERHDKIIFDEHVYALYADLNQPLSDKWSLRTGLRMEYTHTAGENNGRRLEHLKSYINVFPTLFLGFNPNDRHAFSLNGTVRLNRPHFGQLSPFASYENQYSVMRGKEDLRAAKRAQLALGYTFLGALDFQLDGGYLWDGITQVIRLDPKTNKGSYTHDNAEKTWTFGLENSFFFNKVSFFQTYISQRLWYSDMKIGPESTSLYGGAGLSYHVSLNNTFFFNRSKTFQGTCYLYYRTPSYDGGFHMGHMITGGAGLSYTLLQGKLRLALDAYNLLRNNLHLEIKTPDYQMHADNENSPFYCSLGVTYSFGAPIQGKSERKSAEELRSRM